MQRYSIIHTKLPRELVLLQGTGCRWRRCIFCNYHEDVGCNPFELNKKVLEMVTGEYGVLDIINSGSAMELDEQTIALIGDIVCKKNIHTLWFEAHYMYRHRLREFASCFAPAKVKFRCGIETFDATLRDHWNKGVPNGVKPTDVANYFQGVCLLCCTVGETRERILADIAIARKHFEYFSVNVFCENGTSVHRDDVLVEWFADEVYPTLCDWEGVEVLIENTDLGVGD
ncbi:MAG: radical SAM protein [Bacteroidales bacterium]|nr:radical SAM protein [Bacteroidales bacterium]